VWASELRKADERADRFKQELDFIRNEKNKMLDENRSLFDKVRAREAEIERLHHSYKGGSSFGAVKQNFN